MDVSVLNLVMLAGKIEPRWTTDIDVLCCLMCIRREMDSSIFYGRLCVLPSIIVCTVHFLYRGNIVMPTLNMGSSDKTDSKDSYSYSCIVVDLKLFMLLMGIGFVPLSVSFFDLYSIVGLSIVMEIAGFSSTGFISPVPFFIYNKGNVYPFSLVEVLALVTAG